MNWVGVDLAGRVDNGIRVEGTGRVEIGGSRVESGGSRVGDRGKFKSGGSVESVVKAVDRGSVVDRDRVVMAAPSNTEVRSMSKTSIFLQELNIHRMSLKHSHQLCSSRF
jgi:hypothetical protein